MVSHICTVQPGDEELLRSESSKSQMQADKFFNTSCPNNY